MGQAWQTCTPTVQGIFLCVSLILGEQHISPSVLPAWQKANTPIPGGINEYPFGRIVSRSRPFMSFCVLQAEPQPHLAGVDVCAYRVLQDKHHGAAEPRGCCAVSPRHASYICLFTSPFVDAFVPSTDEVGQEQAWAGTYCMLYVLAP